MMLEETKKQKINALLEEINRLAKNLPTAFTISNTKKDDGVGIWFPPLRHTRLAVAGSAIVYTVEQAIDVASYLNGKVDYIFVDVERKSFKGKDIEKAIFDVVDKSEVFTFKANDLTVSAVDSFISQVKKPIHGRRVAIIGAGNIGSKLALTLVERGADVLIYRRNKEYMKKIANALNIIKTGGTLTKVKYAENAADACKDADIVIGCTPGIQAIDKECINVMKNDGLVIDVGKGSVSKDVITNAQGIDIIRTDIQAGFERMISTIFATKELINKNMGRRKIDGITIISGGIMGREGEIIVDNYKNPQRIIGFADGVGDIKRVLSTEEQEKIASLQSKLGLNKGKNHERLRKSSL